MTFFPITDSEKVRILTCLPSDVKREIIDNLEIADSAMTLWLIVTLYFYYRCEVRTPQPEARKNPETRSPIFFNPHQMSLRTLIR